MIDPNRLYPLADYAAAVGKTAGQIRRLANAGLLPGIAYRPYPNAQWMVLGSAILAVPGQATAKRTTPSQAKQGMKADKKRALASV